MKRIILLLASFALTSGIASAQAGHPGQENNLRGLKGIRLVVNLGSADGVDEADRPVILKTVEGDATAKLQKAGIPLLRYTSEVEAAGSPQLIINLTCDKLNGFVYPLVTNLKLRQRVRLTRDPSIESELVTWEQFGNGGPTLTVEMIRSQVATEIDLFIRDYKAVNLITAEP